MADPFSLAHGVLAVVQAAPATAEKLYEFGKTVHGAKDEIRSLNKKAKSLHVVLQFINDAFQDPKFRNYLSDSPAAEKRFSNLRALLQDCSESMDKLLEVLRKNTTKDSDSGRRKIVNSVKWFYVKDEILAIRDELSETRDTCTFASTGMNMLMSIEAAITKAEKHANPSRSRSPSPAPRLTRIQEYQQQCSDLRQAARDGDNRLVQLLLDKGAPVDCLNSEGRTPLSFASERGYVETARLLIKHQASVNMPSHPIEQGGYHKMAEGKRTPLHWAAANGHIDVIRLLLDNGANMEVETINGRTPALEAAIANRFSTVEFLLDRGANVNAGTHFGWTMLHHACTSGLRDAVEMLLAHGTNVEVVYTSHRAGSSREGPTNQRPLHYVVRKAGISESERLEIVRLLVETGKANVAAQDSHGGTPIHAAVRSHWKSGLEVLLRSTAFLALSARIKMA